MRILSAIILQVNNPCFVIFKEQSGTSALQNEYLMVFVYCSLKNHFMKNEALRNDLFLYDLTIRVLAFWATILFSFLFFTGAEANGKTDVTTVKKSPVYTYEIKSDKK